MTGRSTEQWRQPDPSRYSAAVTKRHELYVRLDALSRRQSACVEAEDTTALLEVLAEREGIVQEIVGLSQEIEQWGAPEHLLGALLVLARLEGGDQHDGEVGELRVWVDAQRMITARVHPLKTTDKLRRELRRGDRHFHRVRIVATLGCPIGTDSPRTARSRHLRRLLFGRDGLLQRAESKSLLRLFFLLRFLAAACHAGGPFDDHRDRRELRRLVLDVRTIAGFDERRRLRVDRLVD